MILSESAADLVAITGRPLFDLDGRAPVVAYTDAAGRVLCPRHRDAACGDDTRPEHADNSAMDAARCDACGFPIAAVMLAARCVQFAPDCYPCHRAYLGINGHPARPCPAHMTYPAEILAAIIDGRPAPVPPWES